MINSDHEEAKEGNPKKGIPKCVWLEALVGLLVAKIEDGKADQGEHDGLHRACDENEDDGLGKEHVAEDAQDGQDNAHPLEAALALGFGEIGESGDLDHVHGHVHVHPRETGGGRDPT